MYKELKKTITQPIACKSIYQQINKWISKIVILFKEAVQMTNSQKTKKILNILGIKATKKPHWDFISPQLGRL